MTTRPSRGRLRHAALALVGSALLVVLAACGSAKDLAGQASPDPTSEPTSEPTESPTTATPSPTPEPASARPKPGECRRLQIYDLVTRVTRATAKPVKCWNKHNAQTYAVKRLAGPLERAVKSGAEKRVYAEARGYCDNQLKRWLKTDRGTLEQSQFSFIVGAPTTSDVAAGANWVRCDVYLRNGLTKMVNLPRNTKGALKGPRGDDFHSCVKGSIATASSTVPCYKKHKWRSVSSIKLGKPKKKKYPGTGKVRGIVKDECGDDVRDYLSTSSSFRYGYITPTKQTWKRGERFGVCFAKTRK